MGLPESARKVISEAPYRNLGEFGRLQYYPIF